jgi:hypothetical protein
VPRRGPLGEGEAGVFRFILVLPPAVAGKAARARAEGAVVSVVGILAVDTDYSPPTPQMHYVVIAESVERVAVPTPAAAR